MWPCAVWPPVGALHNAGKSVGCCWRSAQLKEWQLVEKYEQSLGSRALRVWGRTVGGIQFTVMWCCIVRRGSLHPLVLLVETRLSILDFKLSQCSERRILSFRWFSGVWILYADVSEQSVCSIFIGGVRSSCLHHLWRRDRQTVPKRRHIQFRRRGITQTKEYKIVCCHNTVQAGKIQSEVFVRVVRS